MFAEERPALVPLPVEPFRYYQFGTRTVHLDGFVEVDYAYYAPPPGWLGRAVAVQWDGLHVRLLDPTRGVLLREHRRQGPGRHTMRYLDHHPAAALTLRQVDPAHPRPDPRPCRHRPENSGGGDPDMNLVELQRAFRQVRCSGMAAGLETRLLQAQTEKQAPLDFLSTLVQDELRRFWIARSVSRAEREGRVPVRPLVGLRRSRRAQMDAL